MSDEDRPEETASFVGPCTCDHEPDEHGWGSCDVDDCDCEAGWEE
jgi:hypothetical protein